jgi:hypothetical protein
LGVVVENLGKGAMDSWYVVDGYTLPGWYLKVNPQVQCTNELSEKLKARINLKKFPSLSAMSYQLPATSYELI